MTILFPEAPLHPESTEMLGIRVHRGGVADLHTFICRTIRSHQRAVVAHVNLHAVSLAYHQTWFRNFLSKAQFVYCDGESVRWAAKTLKKPVPTKVGFTRWIWDLAKLCDKEGFRLFLLGARPGVAEEAARRFKASYPTLAVAGTQQGYFDHQGAANRQVIERINQARPDVVVVAFGMPLQEKWIQDNWAFLERGIYLPGGGVLDYAAGCNVSAPLWLIHLHLEWLFRIWREPRRLCQRYFTEIPLFFLRVFSEKLKQIFT